MRTEGSVAPAPSLPSAAALAAVALGLVAMNLVAALVAPAGLRPALVLAEAALVLPGVLGLLLFRRPLAPALALTSLDRRGVLLSLAAGAAFWVLSLGLLELQYAVWAPPPGYLEAFRALHEALRPSGPLDALLSLVAIALAPAVCEELLFRGVVLPALARPLGAAAAVLVSALLFGAIHLDATAGTLSLYRVPFAVAVGIGLGALRLRAGSTTAAVVAHALLNAATFAAAPFADDPARGLPEARPLVGAALLAVGIAASLVVLRRSVDSPRGAA